MPDYVKFEGSIHRLSDGASIPYSSDNSDYQRYLSDVEANPSCTVEPGEWMGLADAQTAARAEIDAEAEVARLRYITHGAGQAQTYQMKLEQAMAYQAAGAPTDASAWPFIAGEAEALAITPAVAAQTIIDTRDMWVAVGALIEKNRMAGKRAVTNAASAAEVIAARDDAIQQLNSL